MRSSTRWEHRHVEAQGPDVRGFLARGGLSVGPSAQSFGLGSGLFAPPPGLGPRSGFLARGGLRIGGSTQTFGLGSEGTPVPPIPPEPPPIPTSGSGGGFGTFFTGGGGAGSGSNTYWKDNYVDPWIDDFEASNDDLSVCIDEADYAVMPFGKGAIVCASRSGKVEFLIDGMGRMTAILMSYDGAKFIYANLSGYIGIGGRHVDAGEPIATSREAPSSTRFVVTSSVLDGVASRLLGGDEAESSVAAETVAEATEAAGETVEAKATVEAPAEQAVPQQYEDFSDPDLAPQAPIVRQAAASPSFDKWLWLAAGVAATIVLYAVVREIRLIRRRKKTKKRRLRQN